MLVNAMLNTSAESADPPERFSGQWWGDVLIGVPLRLLILFLLAFVLRYVIHKLMDRVVARMVQQELPTEVLGSAAAARVVFGSTGGYSARRELRVKTLSALGKSIVTAVIATITVVTALSVVGYDIGPLLASAGIAGVALGFGAQNLVKDFLSGVMMLVEDQFGVGDVIDMGEATGTVESVGMRVTRLRALDGTVWYVRNGEVVRVGNFGQDWARAVIDLRVAYGTDTAAVHELLTQVGHDLANEEPWDALILEPPEVWGVEDLSPDSVLVRLVVKTKPLQQWAVARELRERIKRRFDAEGLEVPFPQHTLWVKNAETQRPDA